MSWGMNVTLSKCREIQMGCAQVAATFGVSCGAEIIRMTNQGGNIEERKRIQHAPPVTREPGGPPPVPTSWEVVGSVTTPGRVPGPSHGAGGGF